jgi:arylsulfatase A-like enzyme
VNEIDDKAMREPDARATAGMNRRRFIQAGAAGAAGAALAGAAAGCASDDTSAADAPGAPKNILLLIVDSLRPDHVGAYGSPQIQTPTIDALAAQGLRFNRAFPEAMVTIPARRSIFTSQRIFPYRNFVPNPQLGRSPGWLPIDDIAHTFTGELQRNGYWVGNVTDNPFVGFAPPFKPFRQSFDRFVGVPGQAGTFKPADTVPWSLVEHWLPPNLRDDRYLPGMREYLANTGKGVDEDETCAARVFTEATNLLGELKNHDRWALVVDCFDPHEPWSAPQKYRDMYGEIGYDGQEVGVTRYGLDDYLTTPELRRVRVNYAAEVTLMDTWLGKFLERFRAQGLDKDTVIVLLSDHGYLLGDRGFTGKVPSQLHPELAQVPFIVVHPDGRGAGDVSSYFASTHDVGPTILSMVGMKPPGWMEGTNLSTLLDGQEPAETRDFHYGGMYNRFYIRTDEWVLIGDNRGQERRMYDLTLDPHEITNVLDKYPDVDKRLYKQILDAAGGPLPYYE